MAQQRKEKRLAGTFQQQLQAWGQSGCLWQGMWDR